MSLASPDVDIEDSSESTNAASAFSEKAPNTSVSSSGARAIDVINIFDFDGTLFASPHPNPKLWKSSFIGLLKNNKLYKGWYQSKRSLDFGEEARSQAWNSWWNEKVVDLVRKSMERSTSLTVLLTGRQYSEFHEIITDMTSKKGLVFDIMGFKPDQNVLHWNLYYNSAIIKKVGREKYERLSSTNTIIKKPVTTKNFKISFIEDLISHHPSSKSIFMWDDREHHVQAFRSLLNDLRGQGKIRKGGVDHVTLKMRYFDRVKEREIVTDIIESHNKNWACGTLSNYYLPQIELIREVEYVGIYFDYQAIRFLRRHFSPPNRYFHNRRGRQMNHRWNFDEPYLFVRRRPISQEILGCCSSNRKHYVVMKVVAKGMFRNCVYCLKVVNQDSNDSGKSGIPHNSIFNHFNTTFIMLAFDQSTVDGFPDRPEDIEPSRWIPISDDQQVVVRGFIGKSFLTNYREVDASAQGSSSEDA
ncbi:13732_t:CDS:1 [Acaulospora colombiana]|uniref:13732_t:CDS:1 n=1 Tax=Acaulospora colombiana TaxID=27376 RepID=A0ACA9MI38_9GLOM|nr:13732_t:CDS:1 [Acaulospora colombiana]